MKFEDGELKPDATHRIYIKRNERVWWSMLFPIISLLGVILLIFISRSSPRTRFNKYFKRLSFLILLSFLFLSFYLPLTHSYTFSRFSLIHTSRFKNQTIIERNPVINSRVFSSCIFSLVRFVVNKRLLLSWSIFCICLPTSHIHLNHQEEEGGE